MAVDWNQRGEYIAKRGMTSVIADEALSDPNALVQTPDPASRSGVSDRTIGYSVTYGGLVTVHHRRRERRGVRHQRVAVEHHRHPQVREAGVNHGQAT